MPHFRRGVKSSLALMAAGLVLVACGPRSDPEAETAVAPVHYAIGELAKNHKWKPGRCLCAGLFRSEAVEDFPAHLLKSDMAAHSWVRNWTECSQHYVKKDSLPQCKAGMTDYICTTTMRADLPAGTTRVLCHVNGKNELLFDEYDVTRQESGFSVTPISVKALYKTYE